MDAKRILSSISDSWFLTEPLLFDVLCTHKMQENDALSCIFRTGKRRIEFNPKLVEKDASCAKDALTNEMYRILLKHPYQRVPESPKRIALKKASDITICENCRKSDQLINARYYNLDGGLSYEEYYKSLKDMCPDVQKIPNQLGRNAEFSEAVSQQDKMDFETSELWEEDDEMSEKIQSQIEKAARSNQWGSVPDFVIEKITARKSVPLNYKRILEQFRASILADRRTLTRLRPNRRYGFDYMGSRYKEIFRLLVAVDASGSIASEDLEIFFSIINRFFKYGAKEIKVIVFDIQITQELDFKKARSSVKIKGRGGTDFQAAVDFYENTTDFDGMIVLTDGFAAKPKISKRKRILWILNNQQNYEQNHAWLEKLQGSQVTWIPKAGKSYL